MSQARGLFDGILQKRSLLKSKEILRATFSPTDLPGRQEQVQDLARILAESLRGGQSSNVMIHGPSGSGKTAVVKFVGNELVKTAREKDVALHFIYLNCAFVDTHYRVLAHIANHFIEDWNDRIPFTGWPTDEVFDKLKKKMDEKEGACIIVLDEIDKLVFKAGDDVLYALSSINDNLQRAKVSVIGISNDLKFTEFLDPRVKSRLGEEHLAFPPYTQAELTRILYDRVQLAFEDPESIDSDAVASVTSLASAENGDARVMLDLLRVAADYAERDMKQRLTVTHVAKASRKLQVDRVKETVRTLPLQCKLVLLSTILQADEGNTSITTGEVYDTYRDLCMEARTDVLTQRRVTDLITELDMIGILQARVISKGRYGRTKQIKILSPQEEMKDVLREDPTIEPLTAFAVVKRVSPAQLS